MKRCLEVGAIALFVCLGCGVAADSGVQRSKKLRDIDDVEARKICEHQFENTLTVLGNERELCMSWMLSPDRRSKQACKTKFESCMASVLDMSGVTAAQHCAHANRKHYQFHPEPCNPTVGQYEACKDAWWKAMGTFLRGLSCDNIEGAEHPKPPQACLDAEPVCPHLHTRP